MPFSDRHAASTIGARVQLGVHRARVNLESPSTTEVAQRVLGRFQKPHPKGRRGLRNGGGFRDLAALHEFVDKLREKVGDVFRFHVAEFKNSAVFWQAGGKMRLI